MDPNHLSIFIILCLTRGFSGTQSGVTLNGVSYYFDLYLNRDLLDIYSGDLLSTSSATAVYNCLTQCSPNSQCSIIVFKQNQCFFYSRITRVYVTTLAGSNVYSRITGGTDENIFRTFDLSVLPSGATNYWPFWSSLRDIIGSKNAYGGSAYSYTNDKDGDPESAIRFNYGYVNLPSGYFLTPDDFTITAWVKIFTVSLWSRIIDFGTGQSNENILFSTSGESNNRLNFHTYDGSIVYICESNVDNPLNTWIFVAAVLNGNTGRIYLNGNLVGQSWLFVPRHVFKQNNYIGGSNWARDDKANMILKDLIFFNRALSQQEVQYVQSLNL